MKIVDKQQLNCYHCGDVCEHNKITLLDKTFCCNGCKLVYELLQENNLCTYYDLNENPGLSQKINIRTDKFAFLEDVEIQQKLIQFTDGKQTHVSFYLPQIHCSSCLYLLENIHKINKGIISSKINFTKKEAFIIFNNDTTTLRNVVETLTSIGYEPHISLQDVETDNVPLTNKKRLYKIGIVGFCFANIMMMSFPEYLVKDSHLETKIQQVLSYLILAFAMPVFFYGAAEFFISAWNGIKHKHLNIDVPIAIAILVTFSRSLYEWFSGTGNGYFDSMSGIVFFMLIGRYFQDKTYQAISFNRDYKSFFPIAVNVLKDDKSTPTQVQHIKTGDVIQIHSNELIPTDGILSKGKANIDYSFVSGESIPVQKEIGEIIYAGGKQLDGKIELIVVNEVSQSYLTNLWNKDIYLQNNKNNTPSFVHLLSKYFTIVLLLITAIAALYWFTHKEYTLMWNAITTVLIVACPCTLLLASTYTNGNILNIFNRNKFYLRHTDVIENITKVNHIVFDKTGTLTQNKKMQVVYNGKTLSEDEIISIVSILSQSSHPLSKAISEYLNSAKSTEAINVKNHVGKGIEAWIEDRYYKIGSEEFVNNNTINKSNSSKVYLMIDNEYYGEFSIKNQYRFGFNKLMQLLKSNYSIAVISGDNNAEQAHLENILGKEADILFNQKPIDKLNYIQHLQQVQHTVMMVGDGLNDAGALKESNVGIAITENSNNFSPACDGILDANQFSLLPQFIKMAQAGKKIIISCFIFSFIYNAIGLYFAVQGILSPFIAAILMPLSSISIILISFALCNFAANKYKLSKYDKNHVVL